MLRGMVALSSLLRTGEMGAMVADVEIVGYEEVIQVLADHLKKKIKRVNTRKENCTNWKY